jgi:MtN3 and saliva related transmembrane protein
MENIWQLIFGYAASICMIFGYMPQAIVTIRTRDTEGIAMTTFLMMALGSVFFVVQGILIKNWPLVITNLITAGCSFIIFGIKIYNDYFKNKK